MSKPIDLFMALLCMILQSVHKRDDFLIEVLRYYEGENGWDFVGEDGEVGKINIRGYKLSFRKTQI
jgi:hypothetical protein